MRTLRVAAAAVVMVALAGCQSDGTAVTSAPESQPAGSPAEVEVDIMSGVPNPSWVMDAAGSAQLVSMVADLAASGSVHAHEFGEPSDEALGFRGFLVRGIDLDLADLGEYDELRVLGSTIVASRDGGADVSLPDPQLSVYTEIRTASESHVDPGVFTAIPVDGLEQHD